MLQEFKITVFGTERRGKICRPMAEWWLGMPRIYSLVALFFLLARAGLAADEETEFFSQAARAFDDRFYDRAEQQFGEFVSKFTESTNNAKAILLQGQARFYQRRFEAAAELLKQNTPKAGPHAAEFVFWTGEALSELGNYRQAADYYRRVLTEFPQSPFRLKASYLEAYCTVQRKEYARAIELLQSPDGQFQKLAGETPADPLVIRGNLLLSDALITVGKPEQARATLEQLTPGQDQPELAWEKNYLLARLDFASATPEVALGPLTNALSAAITAKKPVLEAQTRNLEGDVYRKLNRQADAISSYEKIGGIDGLPMDQKRLALLKTVELLSTSGDITNALARIEAYLAGHTNEPAADLLKIKAGELWLDYFRQTGSGARRQNPATTNALIAARAHLTKVLAQYTNSTHLGRAWLNLGWALWEEGTAFERPGKIQDSEEAFRNAAEKLIRSDDQALAVFKIADAQFFLKRPEAALSNYLAVARNYTDLPQVRNALLAKAYRQLVRASIELNDFSGARDFLAEFRKAFPNNPLTEETLFLFGQALAAEGKAAEARAVFQDFLQNYPGSPLVPEARFSEARTYGQEGNYEAALNKHEEWLRIYTNHVLRPAVEFRRATLVDRAGQKTNAMALFTNFVARFPTNSLAPAAQTWVADYFYEQEQWLIAEQNYQRVFQNTNWQWSPLTYEAQLMAAKTAFKRQGYNDARSYLTNLINTLSVNSNAPGGLTAEAYFVLGDVFLEEPITGSTNAVSNFIEAAKVFDRVATQFPSNKLAILALGKKGDCYLQLASLPAYADSIKEATNAYLAVLNSHLPGLPTSARNQAEVGVGLALRNLAETRQGNEKEQLQNAALNRFLDVVYKRERGEEPDAYYLKIAGLEAGRLAEAMGNTTAALKLYRRLVTDVPTLKTLWQGRINSLEQQLAAVTTP